jgi:3-dehydroquinate synthase
MATIIAVHFLFEHSLSDFFDRMLVVDHHQPVVFTLIVLGLSLDILLPIPSSVLSVWAVVSLGLTGGVVAIWIGLCVACMFGYWLGTCSRPWLLKKFVKTQDMIEARRFSSRYGILALVLLRAVPVLAEASVLTAGLVKMPFRRFMLVTSLSNAGIAFVYAGISAYLNVYTSFTGAIVAGIAVPAAAWLAAGLFGRLKSRPLAPGLSTATTIQAAFKVDYSFPICFTSHTFIPHNQTLISLLDSPYPASGFAATKVQFVVDRDVIDSDPDLRNRVSGYCRHHALDWGDAWFELPGGDAAKKQEHIDALHRHMLDRQLDRHSYVVVIGGGGVLDAAGYAAATFHRGIRTIRMPTTVLAQNDAGIGVKSGINAYGIKNLMGSFTVPHAVINDSVFLATLPARVFRSGFAEAVKVSLIRDRLFFNWIEDNVPRLNQRDEQATQYLIRRCAELHINQICRGGDPFETGSARPLDYGHWSAHKLESLSQHQLLHGEAVAIGMALDALYAVEIGLLEQAEADRLIRLLQQLGFNLWHPGMLAKTAAGENALLAGLEEFRQHLGGELCITLLANIGRGIEVNAVDTGVMLVARDKLFACAGCREYLPGGLNEIDSIA